MRFDIGRTPVRVPWYTLVFLFAISLIKPSMLWLVAALFAHEAGHVFAARVLGKKIAQIVLMPFGAAMTVENGELARGSEFLVAAAGPIISLALALSCAGLVSYFPSLPILELAGWSLMLGFTNLVPALPLDGGRMLRSLLCMFFSERTATRACVTLGFLLSAGLLFMAVKTVLEGLLIPALFSMGFFSFMGAVTELRFKTINGAAAVIKRGRSLKSMPMRAAMTAMHGGTAAKDALKNMRGAGVVAVMDDHMRLLGTLGEGDLLDGMAKKGAGVEIEKLIMFDRER